MEKKGQAYLSQVFSAWNPEPRKTIFGALERRKRRIPINNHLSNCFCSSKRWRFVWLSKFHGAIEPHFCGEFSDDPEYSTQWGLLKRDDFLHEIKALPAAGSLGSQYRR